MDEIFIAEANPVKKNTRPAPDKARPTMKEAIIWSEIISPPLAKRKRSRPYAAAR